MAQAAKTPELALDAKESANLSEAIAKILDQYDIDAMTSVGVWGNLMMTAAAVYGPRAIAIKMRVDEEKKRAKENVAQNTVPFPATGYRL